MTRELRLSLLGTPQIWRGDQPLSGFTTSKAQALLFYLAVMAPAAGETPVAQSRETLTTLLWGEMPEAKARRNLRAVLPDLRRLVGDYLQIDRQSITFDTDCPFWLDTQQFQQLLSKPVDTARWQTAVNLYQDEFLDGFTVANAPDFDLWVLEQRQKLHLTAVESLLTLVDTYKKAGNTSAALANNRRLLALEPWSEPVHRQQMLLLAQSGERSAALAQYNTCCAVLNEEFGVEPLPETIALYEQIRTGAFQPMERLQPISVPETAVQQAPRPPAIASKPSQAADIIVNKRDLPPSTPFFGRDAELAQLRQWVGAADCRLVGIYAIGGQGKSTLAAALVQTLLAKTAPEDTPPFKAIIWQSVLNAPPLAEVLQKWIYRLSEQTVNHLPDMLDQQIDLLLDFLQRQRTLLILDNVESILAAEGHNGRYRPGYESYGQLLQRLVQAEHQGCLLLTSRERPRGLTQLEKERAVVRSLALPGLSYEAGGEMLRERGLTIEEPTVAALTRIYSGNPLALKLVADTVDDIFGGDVAAFLQTEAAVFDNIRTVLDQQFSRLSPLERDLMVWLAVVREPITYTDLYDLLAQPPASRLMLEAIRSLLRRSLVEKQAGGFGLQNVVLEYTTDLLVENVVGELVAEARSDTRLGGWLNRHPLILAQSKTYVRHSQTRLLLQPVADGVTAVLGIEGAEQQLKQRLTDLQTQPQTAGFAAANVLHLLLHMGINLRGTDFSRLHFRQLYLRGVSLPQTDFSHAQLIDSVFTEPFGLVYSVAVSPDGRFIAAGTGEGAIYIWRTADQQLAHVLHGHQLAVDSLAFAQRVLESGDSQLLLASAGNDGRIGVWSLAEHENDSWNLSLTHPQHGRLIFVHINGRLITGVDTDGHVFIWDIANYLKPRFVHQFASAPTRFGLVAYIQHRQIIVIGQRKGIVQLHNANTGELLFSFAVEAMNTILSLAVSQDGQILAVGGNEGLIGLWRVTDDYVQQIGHQPVKMTSSAVNALAFSQDGKTLASTHGVGDNMVRLWSIDKQKGLQLSQTLSGHSLTIWAATFGAVPTAESKKGAATQQLLVTGSSDQTVRVWDAATGQPLYTQRGQPRALSAFDIHPLAKQSPASSDCSDMLNHWLLAAAGYDELVHVWEGREARAEGKDRILQGSKQALYAVAISPNGRFLASAGHSQIVYLWEIATGKLLQSFHGHTNSIYTVGFHPDGNLLASGSTDGTVRLWYINQNAVEDTYSDHLVAVIQAHPEIFYSAEFSADGRFLATVGSDLILRLWDMTQPHFPELASLQKKVHEPGEQDIVSVAFSPDGSVVAGGGSRVIHLWAIQDKEAVYILRQHTLSILSLAFSPDGQLLVSGGHDAMVCVWEIASGTMLHVLHDHEDTVYKVDFTPDGAFVVSCGLDGAIKFWDVQTGACVNTLTVEEPYAGMKITAVNGITEAEKTALTALGAVDQSRH